MTILLKYIQKKVGLGFLIYIKQFLLYYCSFMFNLTCHLGKLLIQEVSQVIHNDINSQAHGLTGWYFTMTESHFINLLCRWLSRDVFLIVSKNQVEEKVKFSTSYFFQYYLVKLIKYNRSVIAQQESLMGYHSPSFLLFICLSTCFLPVLDLFFLFFSQDDFSQSSVLFFFHLFLNYM